MATKTYEIPSPEGTRTVRANSKAEAMASIKYPTTKPAPLGTTERTNQLLGGNYFDTNTGKQLKPFVPKTGVITADSLKDTPPIDVPPPPVSTSASDVARFEAGTKLSQDNATADDAYSLELAKLKAESDKARTDTTKTMNEILGVTETRSDLQKEFDLEGKAQAVNEARKVVRNFNNQLIQEQVALQRQKEEIEKNRQGTFGGALNQELREAERQSVRKQADISLSKLVAEQSFENATFDLNTAKSIIDTKINAVLEPLKLKLDFNKYIDDRMYDSFTKAEQRQWDNIKLKDQRAYEETKNNEETANKVWIEAVQNGAPSVTSQEILRAIANKEYDKAKELASPYIGRLERQREARLNDTNKTKMTSLTPEDKRSLIGGGFTNDEINNIESDINEFGLSKVIEGITDNNQKRILQSVYSVKDGSKLTRESLSALFSMPDDDAKSGFLGFFGRGKTNKEKLDELVDSVKKYQDVGYSDKDILKLMGAE